MHTGLLEYRRNIEKIIDITNAHKIRLVLLTQPVIWDPEHSGAYDELLWMGGVGDFTTGQSDTYYSVKVLADAMHRYNQELLSICSERKLDCINLAALLPKDTTTFYDDVHFNESGAQKVAELVSQHILQNDYDRFSVTH